MLSPYAVFDVNETLLDLGSLDAHFERIFGDATVRARWFAKVLRNAMSLTITGDYASFITVARASLEMVAAETATDVTPDDLVALATGMTSLPAHGDVAPALETLQAAGLTMAALTNSPLDAAITQLENAGLDDFFTEILSVESVRRFKPAPEVYRFAAERLGTTVSSITMVAAHDWDVAGAMRAGCHGALVLRPGVVVNPLYPEPDVAGPDLVAVADGLLRG